MVPLTAARKGCCLISKHSPWQGRADLCRVWNRRRGRKNKRLIWFCFDFPFSLSPTAPPNTLNFNGTQRKRKTLVAPEINISLDQSEGSLLSDDFLDTPDDLDINVDDIETPDETDSLEFLGNGNELEWEGKVGHSPSLPDPQIGPQCSSRLLGPSCQSPRSSLPRGSRWAGLLLLFFGVLFWPRCVAF